MTSLLGSMPSRVRLPETPKTRPSISAQPLSLGTWVSSSGGRSSRVLTSPSPPNLWGWRKGDERSRKESAQTYTDLGESLRSDGSCLGRRGREHLRGGRLRREDFGGLLGVQRGRTLWLRFLPPGGRQGLLLLEGRGGLSHGVEGQVRYSPDLSEREEFIQPFIPSFLPSASQKTQGRDTPNAKSLIAENCRERD